MHPIDYHYSQSSIISVPTQVPITFYIFTYKKYKQNSLYYVDTTHNACQHIMITIAPCCHQPFNHKPGIMCSSARHDVGFRNTCRHVCRHICRHVCRHVCREVLGKWFWICSLLMYIDLCQHALSAHISVLGSALPTATVHSILFHHTPI